MRIEQSLVINRPVEEVFAFMSDTAKLPQWNPAVIDAELTSTGPVDVGTTFQFSAQFLGRRFESLCEVIAYEPNRHFAFRTTSGPISLEARYTFESVDGATRVSEVREGAQPGFYKLAEPIFRRLAQRQMETSLNNLKDLLEAQA